MAGLGKRDGNDASEKAALTHSAEVLVRQVRDGSGATLLQVTGELDLSSVEAVRAAADQEIAQGAQTIVFDLSGLAFMDSSGIAMLLTVAEQVAVVEIREPSANVRRVIEVSGLAEILPMTP